MNENSEKITDLINYTFENRKKEYDFSEIPDYNIFVEHQILKITNKVSQYLEINFDSILFNEILLSIAETELNTKLPDDIINALLFVDDFENILKKRYQVETLSNEFRNLINGLKVFTLTILNNRFSIYDFYVEFINDKKQKRKNRSDFVELYFQFLLVSNFNEEIILKSCVEYNNSEKHPTNYTNRFLNQLGETNSKYATQLYNYIIESDTISYYNFIPNLLIGLYNSGHTEAFNNAKKLLAKNNNMAMKSFSGFVINTSSEIKELFENISLIESINIETVHLKSLLFCMLIENDKTSSEIKKKCIIEILELLKSEDHNIANTVFQNVQYNLDNHEYEKYRLLNIYLNNTKNFSVIKYFFHNFKNPQYLFDILIRNYDASGFRGSIDLFKNSLNHFSDTNKEETEELILDLFNIRSYSLLAVKIILSTHSGIYRVNLLKLSKKESQLFAIDSICNYPHSIDNLLPLLLKLKESNFKEVKDYLQTKLAELIFEVYHESLLNLIKKNLTNSKKDKDFLIPLQKAFEEYCKMREFKAKINDLNPRENERNLMDLYYRLEHENQAKMMKNINMDENSFLSMCKNMIIVRGRAWKNEDSEEILPLGLIESSMMVDTRAYKNPTVYEQNLENF
ncbi:hypothetical protein [Flavobacterium flevense]|nr:hypothetical protein [Flavobacterium flevense]